MKLTYRMLKAVMDEFTDEQLDSHVTIYAKTDLSEDEFYPCFPGVETSCNGDPADGVLDENHPYLVCSGIE